jgi:putative oxidoreductase
MTFCPHPRATPWQYKVNCSSNNLFPGEVTDVLKAIANWWGGVITPERHVVLRDLGLLFMRVTAGLYMALGHGWAKLSTFGEKASGFPDPIGLGPEVSLTLMILAEFVCALMILLGLATRLSTIPLILGMAVAAFVVHGSDPWETKEKAVLYLIVYLTLLLTGPGRISLDHAIGARLRRGEA